MQSHRRPAFRLTLTACLFLLPMTCVGEEWQSLFNGKDLSGWRANYDPDSFAVVDGAIRIQASGSKSAHLFFVGDQQGEFERFKHFELEATVRAEPNSNGGIFVHCDHELRDSARHLA